MKVLEFVNKYKYCSYCGEKCFIKFGNIVTALPLDDTTDKIILKKHLRNMHYAKTEELLYEFDSYNNLFVYKQNQNVDTLFFSLNLINKIKKYEDNSNNYINVICKNCTRTLSSSELDIKNFISNKVEFDIELISESLEIINGNSKIILCNYLLNNKPYCNIKSFNFNKIEYNCYENYTLPIIDLSMAKDKIIEHIDILKIFS